MRRGRPPPSFPFAGSILTIPDAGPGLTFIEVPEFQFLIGDDRSSAAEAEPEPGLRGCDFCSASCFSHLMKSEKKVVVEQLNLLVSGSRSKVGVLGLNTVPLPGPLAEWLSCRIGFSTPLLK